MPELNNIRISLPPTAVLLLDALENAGHEAWCVGGFVRDALLGRDSHDVDVATSAHWREVKSICEAQGWRTYETGVKHGTLTVVVSSGKSIAAESGGGDSGGGENAGGGAHHADETVIEVTTYRCDGAYSDARHPVGVRFVSTIEEDLARRDFTINALAYHPVRGFVDPYGGLDDLQSGVIRAVGDPDKRFAEDALRTLRGCRFCSQLGFRIESETYQAMLAHKSLLAKVSTERITHELDALLLGDHVHDALLATVDVLMLALPELSAMKGCAQVTKYHIYDVLEHTAYVVQNSPQTRLSRWAALCHDMGKPAAAFFAADGVEHFYGHAKVSETLTRALTERLLMSNAFREKVAALVRHHDDEVQPTQRGVRRMLLKLDGDVEMFRALCALKRADALSQAPEFSADGVARADELLRALDKLLETEDVPSLKALAVNGRDIMGVGVPQGPEVGRALAALLDAVVEGDVANDREALLERVRALVE
ncbi:MAG: HD domain-containing protein [Eggerthellaceae bacterium]|nr:HD domain-containing protein [Eggerthellaceae bacterium]